MHVLRMDAHHLAWLSAHQDRTAEWLAERLRDGFDVHHLDGDHGNNDPTNLVLIEAADHMRLHGMSGRRVTRINGGGGAPKGIRTATGGKLIYELRTAHNGWAGIAQLVGLDQVRTRYRAKVYAEANGLPWPPILQPMTPKNGLETPENGDLTPCPIPLSG